MKKQTYFYSLMILFFLFSSAVLFGEPDFKKMLSEIDSLGSFRENDFSCIYTIVSEKPDEDTSVTQVKMFRRDKTDQFVLLILQPEVQKGQGYLQLEDNIWFYDPESRKFSHSSLRENIQGSDAKNSDLKEPSLAEDYSVDTWSEGTLGKYQVYILDLTALNDETSYPKMKIWIRKDINIVLKVENYGLSGRLMRTVYYPNYIKIGGKMLPSRILLKDELKIGEKTQLTMKDVSIADIPDYVFTKSYLEKVNR